jgi:hypothetical protein
MIQEYVAGFANEMELDLSTISIVDGLTVGCIDVHLLHLTSHGHLVSTLVYQPELIRLLNGSPCKPLELRIRSALERLKMLQESCSIDF